MALFAPIYERALTWSKHPRAPSILGLWSFVEAIFFPVPPEVLLGPMCLAAPKRGFWFATISTFYAVLGALVGYLIGWLAADWAESVMAWLGQTERFNELKEAARVNGFWMLLVAGFIPVPFKIFTLASGVVGMPILPFVLGALIGRGKRTFLVAFAVWLGGERMERKLHEHVEKIGWGVLVLLALLIAWWLLR